MSPLCSYTGGLTEGSGCSNMGRWVAPDGSGVYCSMHFIHLFGHGERLVRVEGYEPPPSPPAPPPPDPNLVTDSR